jgi:hypothetical protein
LQETEALSDRLCTLQQQAAAKWPNGDLEMVSPELDFEFHHTLAIEEKLDQQLNVSALSTAGWKPYSCAVHQHYCKSYAQS